jgi:hypothetical protein
MDESTGHGGCSGDCLIRIASIPQGGPDATGSHA